MAIGDDQVLREYFPVLTDDERDTGQRVARSLAAVITPVFGATVPGSVLTPAERAAAERAQAIRSARGRLRTLLERIEAAPEGSTLTPGGLVRNIYRRIRQRSFTSALAELDALDELSFSAPGLSINEALQAFTSAEVKFAVVLEIDMPDGPTLRRKQFQTLKGYGGTRFNSDQIRRLLELRDLLAGGAERDFRGRLLRAECHLGLARANAAGGAGTPAENYATAIRTYHRLLPAGQSQPLTPRQRLVALREAFAQISRGDALFRRSFRFSREEREQIVEAYCAALQLTGRPGVTGPEATQLAGYAEQQLTKVSAGLNFLGYRDSHVPDQSPATLAALAGARIAVATRASDQFERFRTRADQLVDQLAELTQSQLEQEIGMRIAAEQVANAQERATAADSAVLGLKKKSDNLLLGLGAGLAQAVFATVSLGAGGASVSGQASGPGVVSSVVGYLSAKEDLDGQIAAAQSAQRIARRDREIAGLESTLARSRRDFVRDQIAAKGNGEFNADRFFAVANAYEDMARRQLDRACELLYLYERAIAFRRLKSLTVVEAAAAGADVLIAPDRLSEVLTTLNEEAKSDGRGQNAFSLPPWSLRARYPVEFARFLQTGTMEFAISVYELEKLLHGTFNVRVRRIGVEVVGLISPDEGFVGHLTHRGVTLVRDGAATLSPPSTRLAPTDEELRAALARLESGTADRVVTQGLVPLVLGEGRLTISSEPDQPIPGDFELLPIENYGLTGSWLLNLSDADLRGVFDVRLNFSVSLPQADAALDRHVTGLIAAHEAELAQNQALDSVLAISLRRRFPDAFDALAGGAGTFVLRDDDLPDEPVRPRLKAVVGQALDAEGVGVAGIELEFTHAADLTVRRTTGPDGLTEDLSAGLPELDEADRVPPTGTWRIRLIDPAAFDRLDDLMVFLVYSFEVEQ